MNIKFKKLAGGIFSALLMLSAVSLYAQEDNIGINSTGFDFDTGDASVEVIVPNVVPSVYESITTSTGTATVVIRVTTLVTNSWFDATAPYHETAVGIYSDLGRRPASESETHRNMNIAMIHASYHVLTNLIPEQEPRYRKMLLDVGLDPDNDTEDLTTPEGIGNVAGKAVINARINDGMNQLGNAGGKKYNREPYSDYTGYRPKNTAHKLRRPSRWQPQRVEKTTGAYVVQDFITPQLKNVTPYSFDHPSIFKAPFPVESQVWNYRGYKNQADVVLEESSLLDEDRKMKAEMFNDRFRSIGYSAIHTYAQKNQTLLDWIHYDFMVNVASFDSAIAIWHQKYLYDSVRPFSAINYLYGDNYVTAWGGVGEGTVSDLPGKDWKSYVDVPDHPAYPSATASICSAHAFVTREYFNSDELDWHVLHEKGSSMAEPGIVPADDMYTSYATWTEWEEECGKSRVWAGVQFPASVTAGQAIGREVAEYAFDFVMKHVQGNPDK